MRFLQEYACGASAEESFAGGLPTGGEIYLASEMLSKNQADTIVSLQEKTFKMCSYLDFVYRFDDTILAYYWDKNITPEQQKRNAKSLKRIEDTEYLAALMGRGLALEKIAENAIGSHPGRRKHKSHNDCSNISSNNTQ